MLCERKTSTILTTSPSTAKWHSTLPPLPQQLSPLRPTTQRQYPLSFTTYGSSSLESTPQRLSDSTTPSQKSQWHSTQQQQAIPQWQSHSSSQFEPQWQPEPETITAMLALSKMSGKPFLPIFFFRFEC
jgi:hypothetical protein